jgi:hypothetical protein
MFNVNNTLIANSIEPSSTQGEAVTLILTECHLHNTDIIIIN